MPKTSEKHELSVSRCKRLVRPLLSKVHSLTDLHSKYPDKFVLDTELFASESGKKRNLNKPATAHDRLVLLKPFMAPETYEAYVEIFNIFKHVVMTLFPENHGRRRGSKNIKTKARKNAQNGKMISPSLQGNKIPKLSALAAQKLGKSMALGTKSTHYSLNQTALFDPASIPVYLRKYHDQLAEDIDEWLQMEPAAVVGQHYAELMLGYVLHIFVFNLRMLFYTLIPVLCHWLHEENFACLRSLFIECWLYLHLDPDQEEVHELTVPDKSQDPSPDIFWVFHRVGYWQQLVQLLHIKSLEYCGTDAYEGLFLDALICADRLNLSQVDVHELYALMRNNPQHPKNTLILATIATQLITGFRKSYENASTSNAAFDAITRSDLELRNFLQAWLCLSKNCIFNTLDNGNIEIFDACFRFIRYLETKCSLILEYLESKNHGSHDTIVNALRRFKKAKSDIAKVSITCTVLKAFFLDTDLPATNASESLQLVSAARFFHEFVSKDCDEETLSIFMGWLEDQDSRINQFVSILHQEMSFPEE